MSTSPSTTQSSPPLTPEQLSLRDQYLTTFHTTTLPPTWTRLLHSSPATFLATLHLHRIPYTNPALPPKHRSLISLAISSAATHLHLPRIHLHTHEALSAGATAAEIIETLCLTSTLGIHACNIGVPLLVEVLREEGREVPKGMDGMSERQCELKEMFEAKRGYWHAFWEDFLRMDMDFFEAYTAFSGVPWTCTSHSLTSTSSSPSDPPTASSTSPSSPSSPSAQGVLPPILKELIYCAFDASSTHLYQPGLKLHMQNVLRLGGTPEMIMQVLELATLLSTATLDVGLEVLEGALGK